MNSSKIFSKQLLFSLGLLILLFLNSCDNPEPFVGGETHDCTFTQVDEDMDGWIDDTEREIMEDCFEIGITDPEKIKENLIGEWELIGHGEGWVGTTSQPCGYIKIGENQLEFQFNDGAIDTVVTENWKLTSNTALSQNFVDAEGPLQYYLRFYTFCEEYMYFDDTPLDGNMYLYQKI